MLIWHATNADSREELSSGALLSTTPTTQRALSLLRIIDTEWSGYCHKGRGMVHSLSIESAIGKSAVDEVRLLLRMVRRYYAPRTIWYICLGKGLFAGRKFRAMVGARS